MMLGTRLAEIRQALGLTQEGLARLLDMSGKTVYNWERGTQPVPRSVEYLLTLWLKNPQRLRTYKRRSDKLKLDILT